MAAAQGASCKADGKSVAGGGLTNVDNWHVPDSGNKIVEAQVQKTKGLSLPLASTYLSSLQLQPYTSKLVVSTCTLISLSLRSAHLPPFVRTYRVSHPPYTTHTLRNIARTPLYTHTHTHRGGETVQSRLQPRRGVADRVDQAAQPVLPQDHSTTSRLWSSLCEGGDKMHSIVKTSGNVRLPRGWRRREQTAVHLTCLQLENNTTPIHCIIFYAPILCMRFVASWKRKGGRSCSLPVVDLYE